MSGARHPGDPALTEFDVAIYTAGYSDARLAGVVARYLANAWDRLYDLDADIVKGDIMRAEAFAVYEPGQCSSRPS